MTTSRVSLLHFNPKGLSGHIDEVRHWVGRNKPGIIGICETFLNTSTQMQAVNISGYRLFRNDRKFRSGGGVCIYCSKDYKATVVAKSQARANVEYVFVEVAMGNTKILVGEVYRPRGLLSDLDEALSDLAPNYSEAFVMGDFNLNYLDHRERFQMDDYFSQFMLNILPTAPTHHSPISQNSSTIDYIIAKSLDKLASHKVSTGILYHDFVSANFRLPNFIPEPPKTVRFRNYKTIDTESLVTAASELPWNSIQELPSADLKVIRFNALILELMNRFAPVVTVQDYDMNKKTWFNEAIMRQIVVRDKAFKRYRRNKTSENLQRYKTIRNATTKMIREGKKQFAARFLDMSLPPKKIWSNMRQFGIVKGTSTDTANITPQEFVDFFSLTSNSLNEPETTLQSIVPDEQEVAVESEIEEESEGSAFHPDQSEVTESFSFSNVDVDKVIWSINKIKSNAVGNDEISIKLLKILLPVISLTITHIFNYILTSSEYPLLWKFSVVRPIAKKTCASLLADFRPVSILPVLSKAFENILFDQIWDHVDSNNLISQFQSGFRAGHSTCTALTKVTDDIRRNIDESRPTVAVFLDFSKAFDSVPHQGLLQMLDTDWFFESSACTLMASYLSPRFQKVVIEDECSTTEPIQTGVVQGSTLGPLLFSGFINRLCRVIELCFFHFYADDLQIYCSEPLNNLHRCFDKINEDLQRINQWSIENGLKLNASKSYAIVIYRRPLVEPFPLIRLGADIVPYVRVVRNLGLYMNNTLTWNDHVNHVCSKVYGALATLRKFSGLTPPPLRKRLVVSLIIPLFTYCDVIYSALDSCSLRKIQVAFNSCVRYIYDRRRFDHVSDVADSVLGYSLEHLFEVRVATHMYKLITSRTPKYLYDQLSFSGSARTLHLDMPRQNSKHMKNSVLARGSHLWNVSSMVMKRSATVASFKSRAELYVFPSRIQ